MLRVSDVSYLCVFHKCCTSRRGNQRLVAATGWSQTYHKWRTIIVLLYEEASSSGVPVVLNGQRHPLYPVQQGAHHALPAQPPQLPIPKLEDTCRRYLDALRPLLSQDQYQRTEKIVKEFGRSGGDGEGPWFDMYLADRRSIMLNYNPYVGMQPDPRTNDQGTNLIYSAVRFRNSLADGKLEPEVYHLNPEKSDTEMFRNVISLPGEGFPSDMSQYSRLFSSTRIPHQHKDELLTFQDSRHVVVLRRGHFYEVGHCREMVRGVAIKWFDKSFSLIVTKQGMAAVNFEHAWGDGASPPPPSHGKEGVPLNRLEFKLSEPLKKVIADGRLATEKAANSLSINMLEYHQYGKEVLEEDEPESRCHSAAVFAGRIAYYRQYKGCVPTYESCSTAAFRHGRTETIRSATMATKACSEAFERSHPADVEAMMKLIKECVVWHSKLVKEAATGQGFDRHLFALKNLAKEEGMVTTPLFEDPAYSYLNHIILSTSTLSSDAVLVGGFAPVTPDGYGVGYGVKDDSLGCHLTTYTTRDGSEYLKHLGQVWTDLYDVMNGKNFKK
eukprot:Em0604g4a